MVKIAFTGDIMLARRVGEKIEKSPEFKVISDELVLYLNEFDFLVGNLECPVSNSAHKSKSTGFKANPKTLQQVTPFHLFSMANNHILDCDKTGASDTIYNVQRNGQHYTGLVFTDKNVWFHKAIIRNKTFSFLSCAVDECIKDSQKKKNPIVIEAENSRILNQIKQAKADSDYTILLVHGGNEMIPFPEPKFRTLCESFIDSGADIVITHHPHVLGGVHQYKGKYIFYSLGDFIFDGESYLRRRGLIVTVNFNDNILSYETKSTQINDDLSVSFASDNNKTKIASKWKHVSHILQNEKKYDSKYKSRYITSLLFFQLDRLYFLLKNKGFLYLVKFVIKKIRLVPFYFIKITSKNA